MLPSVRAGDGENTLPGVSRKYGKKGGEASHGSLTRPTLAGRNEETVLVAPFAKAEKGED